MREGLIHARGIDETEQGSAHAPSPSASPAHAFSVDVEDWTNGVLSMWFGQKAPPTRAVVRNTLRLLEVLAAHRVTATFFVLGDVAKGYPHLLKTIAEAGHALGVHGLLHTPVWAQTPSEFRGNIRLAKELVEQAAGVTVIGHRAPAFSIGRHTPWAFEALVEAGFRYDSSVFPFRGSRYGDPTVPTRPWVVDTASGPLLEVPLSVVTVMGIRIPVCGGGYLRHFGTGFTRTAMRALEKRGERAVVFVHPYELDETFAADMFRLEIPLGKAVRFWLWRHLQYRNRGQTVEKLSTLLSEFSFSSIESTLSRVAGSGTTRGIAAPC